MNERKPKPTKSKLLLREPAKPLAEPEARPLRPDHPAALLIAPVVEAQRAAPSEIQPPRETEPLRETTPVESPTPPKREAEPLRNEPVRIPRGVVLEADAPHLRMPYEVWNNFLRGRKPPQRVILEELFRASAGWHSDECVISIGKLAKHSGIEATQVREHLKRLCADGVVTRLGDVTGGSDKDARGIRFRVNLPRMPPPENRTPSEKQPPRKTEANKIKAFKDESKSVGSCDLCKELNGFVYADPSDPSKGVRKCTHGR